jgi:hypothetical protein
MIAFNGDAKLSGRQQILLQAGQRLAVKCRGIRNSPSSRQKSGPTNAQSHHANPSTT